MNWVSSNRQLSEEFERAMFMSAMRSFTGREFSEETNIGLILDMILMGAEMNR